MGRYKPSAQTFQFIGGSLALDFLNTIGNRLRSPTEYLTDTTALKRWAQQAGLRLKRSGFQVTDAELTTLRLLREDLYLGLIPFAHDKQANRVTVTLNRHLRVLFSLRELQKDGAAYHWTWRPAPAARIISGDILLSAAELLTSGLYRKIGQCQDESCGWLFLDRSRASVRRWCRMEDCGNRAKARRFYKHSL